MIVDSGITCYIVGVTQFKLIEEVPFNCDTTRWKKALYCYGDTEPLKIAETFNANVKCNVKSEDNVEFVISDGGGQA